MRIGVLALQGAFIEHIHMLDRLGVESFEIRQKSQLEQLYDGIIIPGGESTVMGKLLREMDMFNSLKEKITDGLPAFGTCAGAILLADKISNDTKTHLATMNIEVKRNAYGRQLGSFNIVGEFAGHKIPMVFIRAPYIERVGDDAQVLSTQNGFITSAKQNNQLVTTFHPELSSDTTVHEYFLSMIKN